MQHPFISTAGQSSGTNPSLLPNIAGRNEGSPSESFATVLERNAQAPERSASQPPQEPPARKQDAAGERPTPPPTPDAPRKPGGKTDSHPASRDRATPHSQQTQDATEPNKETAAAGTDGADVVADDGDVIIAAEADAIIAAEVDAITGDPATETGENSPHMPASLAAIASIIAALKNHTTSAAAPADADPLTEGLSPKDLAARLSTPNDNAAKGHRYLPFMAGGDGEPARSSGQQKADPAFQLLTLAAQTSRVAQGPAQPAQTLQAEMPLPAMGPGALGALRTESTAAVPQLTVHTPAGQRMWAEDVGSRLVWMVGRGESKAELVLTPPNLGKLGISIQVNGDQTTAQFVTANQATREALEHAMPRLREVLQQAGINLGQTDVSTSGEHQAHGQAQAGSPSGGGRLPDGESMDGIAVGGTWVRSGAGVIDTFA